MQSGHMDKLLVVGAGGFFGAILRYAVSGFVQKLTQSIEFPHGTLAVNLIGCLMLGMLTRMDELRSLLSPEARLMVFVGILGAFTTFSTFGNETVNLINAERFSGALLNVGLHVVFGLIAVFLGRMLAFSIWR